MVCFLLAQDLLHGGSMQMLLTRELLFMRMWKLLGLVAGFALSATVSAQAAYITVGGKMAADGSGLTTNVSGATVVDFNNGMMPSNYSGDGAVVTGSVGGRYAAPPGDGTPYLSVPNPYRSGSLAIDAGGDYNYFGLYWGSVDTYNYISFYDDNVLVASFSGSDVKNPANGNQGVVGADYVNFWFDSALGEVFDKVVLTSTNYAFETDNHAFANVPAPAALGLMGLGLMGLGLVRRRQGQAS